MRTYRCHCCGKDFDSNKPKDPNRDTGYGTCDECYANPIGSRRTPKEQAEALKTKRFA